MTQSSATSKTQLRKANAQDKHDANVERMVVEGLMAHANGRRWVWLQISAAQVFQEGSSLDPYMMAFDKGRRAFGLRLLAMVTGHTPKHYLTMTRESADISAEPKSQLQEQEDDGNPNPDQ